MRQILPPMTGRWLWLGIFSLLFVVNTSADQVEMQNGDRYIGKVLSLNNDTLVLQNEVLGTIKLPRTKVSLISFGTIARPPASTPASQTNGVVDPTGLVAMLTANSNLVARVQKQFLGGAGPEAQAKFNELVSGLLTGNLTVEDLRAQARTAAQEVRAARKDLGDSAGFALDGYLAILDQFLGEDAGRVQIATNSPSRKTAPAQVLEE